MNLESLVTSLDLSRQLQQAGCPQESLYYWICYPPKIWGIVSADCTDLDVPQLYRCSAYIAEEMMSLLPGWSVKGGRFDDRWEAECWWQVGGDDYHEATLDQDSAANALAKLYLTLKEKGLS